MVPDSAAGADEPSPTGGRVDAGLFVGSFLEGDDSVAILLRGRGGAETTARLAEHVDLALARGVRFVTVEIIGSPDVSVEELSELFGRTQTRLEGRRGLLVVRGMGPHLLDAAMPPP